MKFILYVAIAVFFCVGLCSCGKDLYGYKKGMKIEYAFFLPNDRLIIQKGKIIDVGDDYLVIEWDGGGRATFTKKELDAGKINQLSFAD